MRHAVTLFPSWHSARRVVTHSHQTLGGWRRVPAAMQAKGESTARVRVCPCTSSQGLQSECSTHVKLVPCWRNTRAQIEPHAQPAPALFKLPPRLCLRLDGPSMRLERAARAARARACDRATCRSAMLCVRGRPLPGTGERARLGGGSLGVSKAQTAGPMRAGGHRCSGGNRALRRGGVAARDARGANLV